MMGAMSQDVSVRRARALRSTVGSSEVDEIDGDDWAGVVFVSLGFGDFSGLRGCFLLELGGFVLWLFRVWLGKIRVGDFGIHGGRESG